MKIQKKLALAVLVALALLCHVSSANAGFQVTFRVDASSLTLHDNVAGEDDDLIANQITVTAKTVNGYTFHLTLTSSNTPNSGGDVAFINHGTNSITGSGAKTIQVIASANGFTSPVGSNLIADSGVTAQFQGGTPANHKADISFSAYYNGANTLASSVPAGTLIGSGGPTQISSPLGNASLSDTRTVTAAAPYTLTLQLKAVLKTAGTNNIDLDGSVQIASPAPAPAGVVLALASMPMLGLGAWVRRRQTRTTA